MWLDVFKLHKSTHPNSYSFKEYERILAHCEVSPTTLKWSIHMSTLWANESIDIAILSYKGSIKWSIRMTEQKLKLHDMVKVRFLLTILTNTLLVTHITGDKIQKISKLAAYGSFDKKKQQRWIWFIMVTWPNILFKRNNLLLDFCLPKCRTTFTQIKYRFMNEDDEKQLVFVL